MKRRIAIILFTIVIASAFTACSGENKEKSDTGNKTAKSVATMAPAGSGEKAGKSVAGKYSSMVGYIQLNEDKSFTLNSSSGDNKMEITGKYTIKDKDIEFNVEKMNGQEVGSTAPGKFEGDSIIGPDGIKYTKE